MRIVITGANRGIGLEFTRQLAERGDTVEAGARHPEKADALLALAKRHPEHVRPHACDVTSEQSVRAFAHAVRGGVDLLINNAGVYGEWASLEKLNLEEVVETYQTNAVGPLRVTRAFLPQLRQGPTKRLVHITSLMGSLTDNTSGGAYAYRMSKAALNMAARSQAVDLGREGFITVVFNPGWVQTDMGGKSAPTPVDASVSGMLAVIDRLQASDNGQFFDFSGRVLPW